MNNLVRNSINSFFIGLLLVLMHLPAFGQKDFPDAPDEFYKAFSARLSETGNKYALEEDSLFYDSWQGMQSNAQKAFIALAQELDRQHAAAFPDLTTLASVANRAFTHNVSSGKMKQAYEVAKTTLESDGKTTCLAFLKDTRTLFAYGMLFRGNQSKTYVSSTSYTFKYEGAVASNNTTSDGGGINNAPVYEYEYDENAEDDYASDTGYQEFSMDEPTEEEKTEKYVNSLAGGYSPPSLDGPIIKFEKTDVALVTQHDSAVVLNTSGSYSTKTQTFVGEGGTFDWATADMAQVKASLKKYDFKVNKPELVVNDAKLDYPSMTKDPVRGQLQYQGSYNKPALRSGYPRFVSYTNNVEVRGLDKNLDMKGGFNLKGTEMGSRCMDGKPSVLKIEHDGALRLLVRSNAIEIGEDGKISANPAEIEIYTDKDTIYNNGVSFNFDNNDHIMRLYEAKGSLEGSSYLLPYFNMEVKGQVLFWDLNNPKMHWYNHQGAKVVPVLVESIDYFSEKRYQMFSRGLKFHPLRVLSYQAQTTNKEKFQVFELQTRTNIEMDLWKRVLPRLHALRYVDYDPYEQEVVIQEKLKEWDASRHDPKNNDFDQLLVVSLNPKNDYNATYFIDSSYIKVWGIKKIVFSDSNNVKITPRDSTLKIYKNRSLLFDGKMNTGIYEFDGKNFRFDYEDYLVSMEKIDSLSFPATKDQLEHGTDSTMTGTVYINNPKNKSGKTKSPQYPKLDVNSNSYKYFTDQQIRNGVYDRDFYFASDPFKLDSVASNDPNAAAFSGEFITDGIFPKFRETLTIQDDGSLGLTHKTPDEGYPLYGKDARFFGEVRMDYGGLLGEGKIVYNKTTLKADTFIFYQDSVKAQGPDFVIKSGEMKGISYPDITVSQYDLFWKPYSDSMVVMNTIQDPFDLYNGTASMEGFVVVSDSGINGDGLIKTEETQIVSTDYTFEDQFISGDESFFEVKSDNPMKPAFSSKNVHFEFDLVDRVAEFEPMEEGYASNEFPYAQYRTSIPKARWDMDEGTVVMEKPKDADISSSYFYSTHPEQDSLIFNAGKATYDIEAFTLIIDEVPYIKVAGNHIIPDSNRVYIYENADMADLENAQMYSDGYNQYHYLTKGLFTIKSRNYFEGDAVYQYVNGVGDTLGIPIQNFSFEESEKLAQHDIHHITFGKGEVSEFDDLMLAPGIVFKGKVSMESDKTGLVFDGFVRLAVQDAIDATWLEYYNDGTEKSFSMDLKNATTADEKPLHNGLFMDYRNQVPYVAFVSTKYDEIKDWEMFSTTGMLRYKTDSAHYIIGDEDRISGQSYGGKFMTYSDSLNEVFMEGEIKILKDENIDIPVFGKAISTITGDTIRFNGIMDWQIDLPNAAESDMISTLKQMAEQLMAPEPSYAYPNILYQIAKAAGDNQARSYDEMSRGQYVPLSDVIRTKGITLANADFTWDANLGAYYAEGPFALSMIGRDDINAMVDGYFDIRKTYDGDEINLYLELSPDYWFYFNYRTDPTTSAKMLKTTSSVRQYNQTIKDKYDATQATAGAYVVAPATPADRDFFLENFHADYLGDKDYQAPPVNIVNMPGVEESFRPEEGGVSEDQGTWDDGGEDEGWDNTGGGWDSGSEDKNKKKDKKEKEEPEDDQGGWDTGGNDDGWDNTGGGWGSGSDDKNKKKDKKEKEEPKDDQGGWDTGGNDDGWDNTGGGWGSGSDDKDKEKEKEKNKKKKKKRKKKDKDDKEEKEDKKEEPEEKTEEEESGGGWGDEDSGGDDGWDSGGGF